HMPVLMRTRFPRNRAWVSTSAWMEPETRTTLNLDALLEDLSPVGRRRNNSRQKLKLKIGPNLTDCSSMMTKQLLMSFKFAKDPETALSIYEREVAEGFVPNEDTIFALLCGIKGTLRWDYLPRVWEEICKHDVVIRQKAIIIQLIQGCRFQVNSELAA